MSEVTHGPRARRLISNTAVLATAQVVVRVAALISFPLLTNAVEPRTFGLYLYALQLAAAWAMLPNFGLRAPLLRELTRRPGEARRIVGQVLTCRLLLAAAVLVPTTLWCLAKYDTPRERLIFELLLGSTLLQAVGGTFDEALQAGEAFRASAVAAVVQGLTVSGGIVIGVLLGRPIAWAVGAQVAGGVLWVGLCALLASRRFGQSLVALAWSPEAGAMLRLASGVAVAAQLGAWYGRVDLMAVERLLGAHQLGLYAVPYRALDVAMAGTMTLHQALLPMLARAQAAGAHEFVPRLVTVLRFGLLLFLPFGILVSGLAPVILRIFKPDYAAGAGPLSILIWVAPLVFVGAVLHWVLIFFERPWQPAVTLLVAVATNALLCSRLVPTYGVAGAAAARLAAEASIVLVAAILVHRVCPVPWLGLAARPLLMGLAMAAAWLAWPGGPWPLRSLAALTAFALAGLVARPLEAREWLMVKGFLRREPPPENEP